MELWMYGLGDKPQDNAKTLKEIGFSAVVGGGEANIEAANSNGLDFYHCIGAYSYSGVFANEQYLAVDVNGKRQLWFGSTCPTKAVVRAKNIDDAIQKAKQQGVTGVFIDGARFASPASAKSIDAFFTCFCDDCMQKAAGMGFDTKRMHKSAYELYCLCHGKGNAAKFWETQLPGLTDWFTFRRRATTEHLINFAKAVKSVDEKLTTGIYIFTPSLSWLVGQNYTDLAPYMDIFSPMIYRRYQASEGPACLNFELGALYEALKGASGNVKRTAALLYTLFGFPVSSQTVQEGFPVDAVYSEVAKTSALVGADKAYPIIQLDDASLGESIQACARAGATCVNFFMWNDASMEDAISNGVFSYNE